MEIKQAEMLEAAQFFYDTAKKLLVTERGVHIETLVLALGRMAGSFGSKSFGAIPSSSPGTPVFSAEANVLGPVLMNVLLAALRAQGHAVEETTIDRSYLSGRHSNMGFQQTASTLGPFFNKYIEAAHLDARSAAIACATAAAMAIHDGRHVLAVDKSAAIGVYGLVEGTKTALYL